MKKFFSIFNLEEKRRSLANSLPEIKYHADGISIGKALSFRLSNLPKNLNFITNCLITMSKHAPAILLSTVTLFSLKAKADDCGEDIISSVSNIYLNHSQGNGSLWIRYDPNLYKLGSVNNTCGFFIADRQLGDYERMECACSTNGGIEGQLTSYVFLYGQNTTQELIQCMVNFLNKNCKALTSREALGLEILLAMIGGTAACLLYCMCKTLKLCGCGDESESRPLLPSSDNHSSLNRPRF